MRIFNILNIHFINIIKKFSKLAYIKCITILLIAISLSACMKDNINVRDLNGKILAKPADVVEGWHEKNRKHDYYIVQKWDTLYSIAWSFQVDYRDLIKINHLQKPYKLRAGQRIYMSNVAPVVNFKPTTAMPTKQWFYPASGKIVNSFSSKTNGIDINGKIGDPIIATSAGKVVYTGSAISGYGKLIIIKHNDDYFSAYGLNQMILVKEDQTVAAGQKIATMGMDNHHVGILHFEIRYDGQPQDPMRFLNTVYTSKNVKAKKIKTKQKINARKNKIQKIKNQQIKTKTNIKQQKQKTKINNLKKQKNNLPKKLNTKSKNAKIKKTNNKITAKAKAKSTSKTKIK